jgi:hypothetical protein
MKKYFLLFLILFLSTSNPQTLLDIILLPDNSFYNFGYGLVYENGKYWISSSNTTIGSAVINAVNDEGIQVDQIPINYPSMRSSQGLAYDGSNFWYLERKTARCDLFKVSPSGVVLDSIPIGAIGATNWLLGGAAWDGTGLWISLYSPDASAALYKVDVVAKQIVDTIPVLQLQPTGITIKGDTLFYANDGFQGEDKIYAVDINTKDTLFSFNLPDAGQRQNPRGLAWDGTYFWLLAEPVGASSGRQLFKYDLEGSGTPNIVAPASLPFPHTTVGSSANIDLIIQNVGDATLTVNSININNPVFTFSGVSFPFNITPGGSQPVTVTFTPLGYAFYTGTLTINSNDPVSPSLNVNLSGRGLLPGARIGFTETSHNFGNVWVGEEGISFWKFKTFNMGDTPLEILNMFFDLPEYTYDAPAIPFVINPTDSVELTIYFYPAAAGNYVDSLKIVNSDNTIGQLAKIAVQGSGVFDDYEFGYMFWQYQVPPHGTSSTEPRVEGLKYIKDITGDGISEVIIATENYWIMCLDGAASGNTYPLWTFSTCQNNFNCGSIGANFEYGVQDAIQIANDLNGDGFNDVVIAVGGGNEHVYALDGTNGQIIWKYGDEVNFSLGDFEAIDVQRDFNGDGVVDVLAIADGNNEGTGYKRAYLFNGINGNIIWEHFYPGPNPAFGKSIISINDLNNDNLPDVVIAYGNNGSSNLSVRALNGVNGQTLWTRNMISWEPKEMLELPLSPDSSDVIVAEYFDRIHRLNGRTGEIIWTYLLGGSAGVIQMVLIDDIDLDGIPDIVVASFAGNGLNCLSGRTGMQLWAYPMAFQFGVAAVPDLNADGVSDVIAGDQNGILYCISGNGDSLIFTYTFPGDWIYTVNSMPSIDGNFSSEILVGTKNGKVVCFSGGTMAIPVELTSFTASEAEGKVILNWSTASEINNRGFEIQRTRLRSPNFSGASWERVGFVQGSGTTTGMKTYSFIDQNVDAGTYKYRLKQIDFDGSFSYSDEIEVIVGIPNTFSLEQNFPNPFNPSTVIKFSVPAEGNVKLSIYNILGQEVAVLINETVKPGFHQIEWKGTDGNNKLLPSGVYFYRLEARNLSTHSQNGQTGQSFVDVKKMLFLK